MPSRLQRASRLLARALFRRARHRIVVVPENRQPAQGEPIFIIGCPRSGTSLLRRILNSHSRVACPPESWFLAKLLPLLDDSLTMHGFDGMGYSREIVMERIRVFAEQFFEEYAAANGKARWADKTPVYVDWLDQIDRVFEASPRYLLIYRHGLDVTASINTALPEWADRLPELGRVQDRYHAEHRAASYWREQVQKMRAFRSRHPGRCHELRYEALCEDPELVMSGVCKFLGEPFERPMLDFHRFHHDEGLEDGRVRLSRGIEPSSHNYRHWSQGQLDAALDEAGELLEELGYTIK